MGTASLENGEKWSERKFAPCARAVQTVGKVKGHRLPPSQHPGSSPGGGGRAATWFGMGRRSLVLPYSQAIQKQGSFQD